MQQQRLKVDKFPQFRQALAYVQDSQWHPYFIRMAEGKLIKNTRINGDTLIFYRNKTKTKYETFNINIPIQELAVNFVNFLTNTMMLGQTVSPVIESVEDETDERSDAGKMKPGVLANKISFYSNQLCSYYGLTAKDASIIAEKIMLALELKYITKKDINLQNGYISSINGVTWDPTTRYIHIPSTPHGTSSSSNKKVTDPNELILKNMNTAIASARENFVSVVNSIGSKCSTAPHTGMTTTNGYITIQRADTGLIK